MRVGLYSREDNGPPFYAGAIEYETTFDLVEIPEGEDVLLEVAPGLPFQDAIEVALNSGPLRPSRTRVS
jgi:hypothetical protein